MVSTSDFLEIDYTSDLTEAGIAYTCRKLVTHPPDRKRHGTHHILTGCVASAAVELAFRRFLISQEIPHRTLDATPFSKPGRLEIIIGERRCNILLSMITKKSQIRMFQKNPTDILAFPVALSKDEVFSDLLQNDDLYIFAILKALVTPNLRSLTQATQANQPVFMIYVMPSKWSQPDHWNSFGNMTLKSSSNESINLILEGRNSLGKPHSETFALIPGEITTTSCNFYSLHILHTQQQPQGTLGIHSPVLSDTYHIQSIEWRNIWVYGIQITFTGFMTRGEYLAQACNHPINNQVQKYLHIGTDDLSIPVSNLYPLQDLFIRAKLWGQ